jgi:hypothetical protein
MQKTDLVLFVSHVSEDAAAALEIVAELERRGVPCWVTPRNVRPGRPFDEEIAVAIEHCRAMLLIFSEHCNGNDYIRREVTVAGELGKDIVPFRIEDVKSRGALQMRLSDLHWINGFRARERAIDEVVRIFMPAKDEARSEPPSLAPSPAPSPVPGRNAGLHELDALRQTLEEQLRSGEVRGERAVAFRQILEKLEAVLVAVDRGEIGPEQAGHRLRQLFADAAPFFADPGPKA